MSKSLDLSPTCCQILGPPLNFSRIQNEIFSYTPGSGKAGSVGSASTLGGAMENRNCLSLGFDDFLSPLCWQTMFTRCFSLIHRNISFRCCLLFNAWFSIYVQARIRAVRNLILNSVVTNSNSTFPLHSDGLQLPSERSHDLAKNDYGHWA